MVAAIFATLKESCSGTKEACLAFATVSQQGVRLPTVGDGMEVGGQDAPLSSVSSSTAHRQPLLVLPTVDRRGASLVSGDLRFSKGPQAWVGVLGQSQEGEVPFTYELSHGIYMGVS